MDTPKELKLIYVPFFRLDDARPERQMDAAIRAAREEVALDGLQIVSVETVTEPVFLWLGSRPVGLRVWCLAPVEPDSAAG